MSDARRSAFKNEMSSLRERVARARRRLERENVHELASQYMIDAFAAGRLYEAVRDALDILNRVPEGYWKKRPREYRPLVAIEDLGNDDAQESPVTSSTEGKR